MKVILSAAFMLLSVAALADVSEAQPTSDQSGGQVQPTAEQLLRDVVARLPVDPIHVSGQLLVRKRRGVPVSSLGFDLKAYWGESPARASYHIRDAFGGSLEKLTITHDGSASYGYEVGDPLHEAELPDLSGTIQNTDLSWIDLTLAYLWWPNGKIVGEESIRTFDCYILDIPAPRGSDPSSVTSHQAEGLAVPRRPSERPRSIQPRGTTNLGAPPYARVRLWISKKARMMLQAEGYDADDKLLRKLWVRSCKKIDDQWMIKDMEIQSYPVVHRTKLRVTEVETITL